MKTRLIEGEDVPTMTESTSIPKNPRTDRPVGYAFVDLSTPARLCRESPSMKTRLIDGETRLWFSGEKYNHTR